MARYTVDYERRMRSHQKIEKIIQEVGPRFTQLKWKQIYNTEFDENDISYQAVMDEIRKRAKGVNEAA
jgi:hypothetical protein